MEQKFARPLTLTLALAAVTHLAAQEVPPGPHRPRPLDRLRIEMRGDTGETPVLMLAPRLVPPVRFAGIAGQLELDLGEAIVVPLQPFGPAGRSQLALPLPVGIQDQIPFFGQVLTARPQGTRLVAPFQVFGDRDGERRLLRDPNRVDPRVDGLPRVPDQQEPPDDRAPVAISQGARPGELKLSVWMLENGTGAVEGQRPGRIVGSPPLTPEGPPPEMSGLSSLSSSTSDDYPYRMNCRLQMSFPGSSSTWQGSGALIDPYHVITAGHCVYDHDLGGYADSITVTPAYDDDRSDPAPFGSATWVRGDPVLIWSDWVSSRTFKHDIAIIRLDRPIGGLTSWFGYGWSSSCSKYKDNTWYSGSYPVEGSYTGNDMYWRSGQFDYCPTSLETRFWLRGYGGESGSGYYYINDGSRYVHGVMSHGTWTVWHGDVSDIVRLGEDKFEALQDFLRDARPSGADLVPFAVDLPSTTVTRGGSVAVSFKILNYGRTDFTSSFSYEVRFSTNDFISTYDARAMPIVYVLSPTIDSIDVDSRTVTVTVPTSLGTGTHYVGVRLVTSDADTSNDTTAATEVFRVTVL